jgi:hypothetical protein
LLKFLGSELIPYYEAGYRSWIPYLPNQ